MREDLKVCIHFRRQLSTWHHFSNKKQLIVSVWQDFQHNKRNSHRETNTYFWFFGVPGYDQGVIVLHKTLGLAELRGQPVRPSAAQPQSNPSLRHFLGIVAHAFPKLQLFLIKAAGRKTAWFSVQIEEPNSCAQAIWVYPATLDFWILLISD